MPPEVFCTLFVGAAVLTLLEAIMDIRYPSYAKNLIHKLAVMAIGLTIYHLTKRL